MDKKSGASKNTVNYNNSTLSVAIAANNATGAIYFASVPQDIELIIAGTFVGTIEVQSAPINADLTNSALFGTIASYTDKQSKIITVVAPTAIRCRSVAWTSGTAYTSLIVDDAIKTRTN